MFTVLNILFPHETFFGCKRILTYAVNISVSDEKKKKPLKVLSGQFYTQIRNRKCQRSRPIRFWFTPNANHLMYKIGTINVINKSELYSQQFSAALYFSGTQFGNIWFLGCT